MAGHTPRDVHALTVDPAAVDDVLDGWDGDLVVDAFGGPGGWTTGIVDLLAGAGLREVALEWDDAACQTRRDNGHPAVIRCDVAAYPSAPFVGRTRGGIFSPPCQTFSAAGGKAGVVFLAMLAQAAHDVTLGVRTLAQAIDELAAAGALDDKDGNPDPRNGLILQPARWLRDLADSLEWVALEQVPPARPVFEGYALALRSLGWRTVEVVVLNAADYGVPQTRERVILLAHRTKVITVPEPTHTRGGEPASMFGPGRLPWVSMARALGWAGELVGFPRRPEPADTAAEVVTIAGTDYRARDLAPTDGPSLAVTAKGRSWARFHPDDVELVPNGMPHATRRSADEPAPTIAPGKAYLDQRWQPGTDEAGRFLLNRRAGKAGPNGDYPYTAPPVDVGVEPCPTVTSAAFGHGVFTITDRLAGNPEVGEGGAWAEDRPATVVASREIVQHPGATANRHNDSAKTRNDGLRVTEAEGAILQGFPGDYAWAGDTKSKRWEQIGNVVCPPVARRVVAALLEVVPEPLPWHRYAFAELAEVEVVEGPRLRMGTAVNATEREPDEPAPTVFAGSRANGITWEAGPKVIDRARARMVRDVAELPPDAGALF